MSRPLRIVYEGAWYHVMNRGAGRRTIFHSDTYRQLFLALLGEITQTFGVEVHAYCLMDNHYHLLLHTPRANLSAAMRHLQRLYTQRHNRMEQTDGPLFRGRFKAILVDADHYLSSNLFLCTGFGVHGYLLLVSASGGPGAAAPTLPTFCIETIASSTAVAAPAGRAATAWQV